MIRDRPASLLAMPEYGHLPATPFSVGFNALPELVRTSLGPLGGIQPVTLAMSKAADGALSDIPSAGEVELFHERGTQFQMVSVVMNLAAMTVRDGAAHGTPYALSLIPASKRGAVDVRSIDLVAKLDLEKMRRETEPCYMGYDPFSGDWSLYGPLRLLLGGKSLSGFVDELGLVVAQYFLATDYSADEVLVTPLGFTNPKSEEKYHRHREKLLYTPFKAVEARRVWGAESPIELFLIQELLRRGLSPMLQVLFYDDGSSYPSLYHLWRDIEFRRIPGMITEADLYFPDQRVAVFCDSTRFHRSRKAQAKDQAISDHLTAIGVKAVRVPGAQIVGDLTAAADQVCRALE